MSCHMNEEKPRVGSGQSPEHGARSPSPLGIGACHPPSTHHISVFTNQKAPLKGIFIRVSL